MIRAAVLCLMIAVLAAAEWRLQTGPGPVGGQPVPLDALSKAGALRLQAARTAVEGGPCWVELRLVAADGRRYATAAPLQIPEGERRAEAVYGLDAGSWTGRDGTLGADAVQAMASLEIAVHGWQGEVQARVETIPVSSTTPSFTVIALHQGLVEVGPWREWRLRLAGGFRSEQGELDLIDAAGRRWPMFLDQPGAPDASGRWRAQGPARWVLRLAPQEAPAPPCRLHWSDGDGSWQGPEADPGTVIAGREELPGASRADLPIPVSPSWEGPACRSAAGAWLRLAWHEMPEALAPVIAWRCGWTGFRGAEAVSWPQAEALDRRVAAGSAWIDLLPAGLAEEQGPFRFGLSPWTGGEGPWKTSRDLWLADQPWQAWRRHVRAVLARCRAAPGLSGWSLGIDRPANDDEQRERLLQVAGGIASLVAALDGRPLLARHPQLTSFTRTDPNGIWYAFTEGAAGWTQGPVPLSGPVLVERKGGGSDGDGGIAVPVAPGGEVRVAGAQVALDSNLFNLDRLEMDVALTGGGEATLYVWLTDHRHRWWQQRLARIPGDGGWQTVGVDCGERAAWTSPGAVWSDDVRRRIRALGVVAYVRGAGAEAQLKLDRVRRLGWPALADPPQLRIASIERGAPAIQRWQPISASFALNLTALNPYDPDSADVVGEVEGPGGARFRHPAYWCEPQRLDFDGKTETAVPSGPGGWRWRWTPPKPGAWRWRIVARVKVRDAWQQAESAWTTVDVGTAAGGMQTVGSDPSDPRWFAKADGSFWYPIGINLRSPGDERQDNDLERERAFKPFDQEPAAIRGWRSIDWQRTGTRAYERWFSLMRENGMDWARVWMCPWWCGLEWRRDWDDFGGLTWYSQANAARMDRVMELAAQHGVYVQVELMNHGMVGEHADRQWGDNPYNRRLGGPCRHVGEWFKSDEVWKTNAKRLRYTLARWGWCTNLAAWSLSSELEFTGTFNMETGGNDRGFSPSLQAWIERSLAWMRENDPQQGRLTTIHWSHPWSGPQHWRTPGLGFSNSNVYTAFQDFDESLGGRQKPRNLPIALDAYLNQLFPAGEFRRPTLIGEWGGHWADNQPWILRGELRTGIWLQCVTAYAANTGWWWWLWLDVADQWKQYGAAARFMQGEERRGIAWTPIQPRIEGNAGRLLAQGMRADRMVRLYVWPKGMDQDHRRIQSAASGDAVIDTLPPGSAWRVRRYDGATGEMVAERELTADAGGILRLPLAAIAPDAVFKLDRK